MQLARLGVLELLTELSRTYGPSLGQYASDSMGIASKVAGGAGLTRQQMGGGLGLSVRVAGLRLAAGVVEGLSPGDRSVGLVQAEGLELTKKYAKVKSVVGESCVSFFNLPVSYGKPFSIERLVGVLPL